MEALREAGHEVVEFDRCGRADGKASADPLECAGDLSNVEAYRTHLRVG